MEIILSFLAANISWFFSGVLVAVVSVIANVITKYFVRLYRNKPKVVISFTSKTGDKYTVELSGSDSQEKIAKAIKEIKGDDFVEPSQLNKEN